MHCGPDDEGYYVRSGRVGLGFRRLSIIDLPGGSQPLGNETYSVIATCNGEIYNFRDLPRELVGEDTGSPPNPTAKSSRICGNPTDRRAIRGCRACSPSLYGMIAMNPWR